MMFYVIFETSRGEWKKSETMDFDAAYALEHQLLWRGQMAHIYSVR